MRMICFLILAVLCMPVFAESAPVYDADSLPPFEQGSTSRDQGDLPPPPPPPPPSQGDNGSGFVPMQQDQGDDDNSDQRKPIADEFATPLPSANSSLSTTERLRRLEQKVTNLQASERNVKMDALQTQIQSLRSDLDQLSHQVQQLQKQQKRQTDVATQQDGDSSPALSSSNNNSDDADTDTPVTAPKAKKPTVTNNTTTTKVEAKASKTAKQPNAVDKNVATQDAADNGNAQPNVQEEQQIYQTAYNLIKSKKYAEAITALKNMIKKYPSGQFASNAHYWLGELYGLSGKNDQALTEFAIVVKDYSDSPRVAEAQLKIGLIYAAQSKWTDAKASLKKVVTQYPGTTSARLAAEQLKQIRQVGH